MDESVTKTMTAAAAQPSDEVSTCAAAPVHERVSIKRVLSDAAISTVVASVQLVAQWLPARRLLAGATALGYFFYYAVRFRRAVVESRIARVFPLATPVEQRLLARDSYVFAGLSLLWLLRLPTLNRARIFDDLVHIDDAASAALRTFADHVDTAKGSAIVSTGHIGMWEFLPAALASPQCEQYIVYRPLHQQVLDCVVTALRQAPQRHLVPDKHCFALLHDALQTPANVVGLVADQCARPSQPHADVAFLGQPTRFATGAARLLLATQATTSSSDSTTDDNDDTDDRASSVSAHPTLWFGALLHNHAFYAAPSSSVSSNYQPAKPFELVLEQIPVSLPSDSDSEPAMRVAAITQRFAHRLETLVRTEPAQYLWLHDLWRDAPLPLPSCATTTNTAAVART